MVLAKIAQARPETGGVGLVAALPQNQLVERWRWRAGVHQFYLRRDAYHQLVPQAIEQGYEFGRSGIGQGRRIQVEFVSANPDWSSA